VRRTYDEVRHEELVSAMLVHENLQDLATAVGFRSTPEQIGRARYYANRHARTPVYSGRVSMSTLRGVHRVE